jgi:hypothetical protein
MKVTENGLQNLKIGRNFGEKGKFEERGKFEGIWGKKENLRKRENF